MLRPLESDDNQYYVFLFSVLGPCRAEGLSPLSEVRNFRGRIGGGDVEDRTDSLQALWSQWVVTWPRGFLCVFFFVCVFCFCMCVVGI